MPSRPKRVLYNRSSRQPSREKKSRKRSSSGKSKTYRGEAGPSRIRNNAASIRDGLTAALVDEERAPSDERHVFYPDIEQYHPLRGGGTASIKDLLRALDKMDSPGASDFFFDVHTCKNHTDNHAPPQV